MFVLLARFTLGYYIQVSSYTDVCVLLRFEVALCRSRKHVYYKRMCRRIYKGMIDLHQP